MAEAIAQAPGHARLAGLLELAERSEPFRELRARLEDGGQIALADASAGGRAYAWSALVASGRRIVLVSATEDRARRWRAELAGWLGDDAVLAFPERETMPYEIGAPSATAVHGRLLTLRRLADGEACAVVVSLRALLQHTITPSQLAERSRTIRTGDRLPWQQTARWLLALGYESVPEVSEAGTFSRRGGIIDVYPAGADGPARIELFGDDIETIRAFDPVTQRSQDALASIAIVPPREFTLESAPEVAERLAASGWADQAEHEELGPYAALLDPLRQQSYVPGADLLASALGATASLLDHTSRTGTTVVLEDSIELALQWDAHEAQAEERREELRLHGLRVGVLPPPYLGRTGLEEEARARGVVRVVPGSGSLSLGWTGAPTYAGRLDAFLREVAQAGEGTRVVATPQAARLAELLSERQVTATPHESLADAPAQGALVLLHVPLAQGFRVPELGLTVFTDAEVFGFRKPRHPERQRRRRAVGTLLQDLKPGDFVVHEDSGIARFEGFEDKHVLGVSRESLVLTFADGTRWLPTERIDKITRYVGGSAPPLSVMGGAEWHKTKRKAKKAAEEIARELLAIYAARESSPGHAFGRDTPWQIEMENAFPFTETPDQLTAIEDVKRDMEAPRPMDRLIVRRRRLRQDRGRAPRRIQGGARRQAGRGPRPHDRAGAAALRDVQRAARDVPGRASACCRASARRRSRSRRSRHSQAGEIDIVIGTHRVLQKDVAFRDLGLVVIDEEHRFGVGHKERLKALRTQVDVLTMTATPIPRTLHMALSGVRDISVIETPPEDRQPIETRVVERTDDVAARGRSCASSTAAGRSTTSTTACMGIEQRDRAPAASWCRRRASSSAHGQMHERDARAGDGRVRATRSTTCWSAPRSSSRASTSRT